MIFANLQMVEKSCVGVFVGGTGIGVLGGLIGFGGAEFCLFLLIGAFCFVVLEVVIVNKVMSLIVVALVLLFCMGTISFDVIVGYWTIIANLLVGSLIGVWVGASWATRLKLETFYWVFAILLVAIVVVLVIGHDVDSGGKLLLVGGVQLVVGIVVGFLIGVVVLLMGVAGGELLILTLILLFGADVKLAGSLSLVVSLPIMLVGFACYSCDSTFVVLCCNCWFVLVMVAGFIVGSFIGAALLGIVLGAVLLFLLVVILLVSVVKVWRYK